MQGNVNWVIDNGELSGNGDDLLPVDGAQTAKIEGGGPGNSLNIIQQAGSVNAAIDTDHVTLVSGQDVLAGGAVGTFNDFSNPTGLVQFGGLSTTGASTYMEGGFQFQDVSSGQLVQDRSTSSALTTSQAQDVVKLTATDGGFFALYQVSLSVVGTVVFSGTTANGLQVSQTISVNAPRGFTAFPFPSSFSPLAQVTFSLGSLKMTNLVANEIFTINSGLEPTPNVGTIAGTMPTSPETIYVNSDTPYIYVNGFIFNGGIVRTGTMFVTMQTIAGGTEEESSISRAISTSRPAPAFTAAAARESCSAPPITLTWERESISTSTARVLRPAQPARAEPGRRWRRWRRRRCGGGNQSPGYGGPGGAGGAVKTSGDAGDFGGVGSAGSQGNTGGSGGVGINNGAVISSGGFGGSGGGGGANQKGAGYAGGTGGAGGDYSTGSYAFRLARTIQRPSGKPGSNRRPRLRGRHLVHRLWQSHFRKCLSHRR